MAEVGEKREREEAPVDMALRDLEASASREPEHKVKALKALRSLIDPLDESYQAQQIVVESEELGAIVELLKDQSDGVATEAAMCIAALAHHSQTAHARLKRGSVTGFAETPEKVALNPVLSELAEEEGLTRWGCQ
jgi:hypothetical protein